MIRSEERFSVNLETQNASRVRLRKYVETEPVEETVKVYHEEYEIERVPIAKDDQVSADLAEGEQEIILREVRAIISKESVPVERVRLTARKIEEDKIVRDELRRERIEILGDDGKPAQSPTGKVPGQQSAGRSPSGQPPSGQPPSGQPPVGPAAVGPATVGPATGGPATGGPATGGSTAPLSGSAGRPVSVSRAKPAVRLPKRCAGRPGPTAMLRLGARIKPVCSRTRDRHRICHRRTCPDQVIMRADHMKARACGRRRVVCVRDWMWLG